MSTLEYIYLACAIAGAIIFILRMILLVAGGFGAGDGDLDAGGDLDGFDGIDGIDGADVGDMNLDGMDFGIPHDVMHDVPHDAAHDMGTDDGGLDNTDLSFRFLSIQGVSSFIMMFGIVGLAIAKASPLAILSLFGATGSGVFTVWVVSLIFKWMSKLQSDGTMHVENAIEQVGTVYLTIPAGGEIGKISVVIQGGLRTLEAVSNTDEAIKTGSKVKVVATRGTLLVVEPIMEE